MLFILAMYIERKKAIIKIRNMNSTIVKPNLSLLDFTFHKFKQRGKSIVFKLIISEVLLWSVQ